MQKIVFTIVLACMISTLAYAQAEVIAGNLATTLTLVVTNARSNFSALKGERTDNANVEEYKTTASFTGCEKNYIHVNSFGSNFTQWIAFYEFESKEKTVNEQFYNAWYEKIKATPIIVAGKKCMWTPIVDPKNPSGVDEGGDIIKSLVINIPFLGKQQLSLALTMPPPGFDIATGLTVEVHQIQ